MSDDGTQNTAGGPPAPSAQITGGGPAPPAGGPTPPVWYEGQPPEVIGYLQNKGWADADPKVAMAKIVDSYKQLEGLRGVPLEQILRLPAANAPPEEWRAVYERLGAPRDAAGYDFPGEAFAFEDETVTRDVHKAFAEAAFENGLSKAAAQRYAQSIIEILAAVNANENTAAQAKLAASVEALNLNWGPNRESNLFIARQAAAKFGITEETINALESVMGYANVMETFLKIGVAVGEDRYVAGVGPGTPGVMTREGAIARREEMLKDKAWAERFNKGGRAERAEFDRVMKQIVGV